MNLVILVLLMMMGINASQLMYNEEMIMCISLGLFISSVFFLLKAKVNLLSYIDIKAMYIYFIYIFLINIKSVSMFITMYHELSRVIELSYVSEYMINALAGLNNIHKSLALKYRYITAIFSSYWISRLHIFRSLLNIKMAPSHFLSELSCAVAYDVALRKNSVKKILC